MSYLLKSALNSRATLASVTLLSVGSIAWYTHLYGILPFLGEVHASSAGEVGLHPTAYPWPHKGLFDTFDHARYIQPIVMTNFWSQSDVLFVLKASDAATKSIAKSVQLAIPSTALPGATSSASLTPSTR